MLCAPKRPLGGEGLVIGQRAGRDRHQVGFLARVEHPDQLRPVLGVVLGRLVGHQHQPAVEQRHHRVHESGIGRRVGPLRDPLRVRLVGDVEDEHAAVDIGEIAAVRTLRIDVAVVRAVALVERMARRRHHVVALLGAGHVPAADLDRLRRIAHVDAAIELVVGGMRRLEVGRARRACGRIRRRRTRAGARRARSVPSSRRTRSTWASPAPKCRTAPSRRAAGPSSGSGRRPP